MAGEMCRVPVKARMVKLPDGSYKVDKENSVFVQISEEDIARILIRGFGREAIFKEGVDR